MERVFYNAHDKVSKLILRKTTPFQRSFVENAILFLAVISFSGIILFHRTFAFRGGAIKSLALSVNGWNIPSMCLGSVEGVRDDVDVTHVVIYERDFYINCTSTRCGSCNSRSCSRTMRSYPQGSGTCTENGTNFSNNTTSHYCPNNINPDDEHNNNGTATATDIELNSQDTECSTKDQPSDMQMKDNNDVEEQSFVIFMEPLTGIYQSSRPLQHVSPWNVIKHDTNIEALHNQLEQEHYRKFISQINITYSFSSIRGYLFLPPVTM